MAFINQSKILLVDKKSEVSTWVVTDQKAVFLVSLPCSDVMKMIADNHYDFIELTLLEITEEDEYPVSLTFLEHHSHE